MNTNARIMTECKMCPQCHKIPSPSFEYQNVSLVCERHGHMASGATLEDAVHHWNRYVDFLLKDALAKTEESAAGQSFCFTCSGMTSNLTFKNEYSEIVVCGRCHLLKWEILAKNA